MIESKQNYSYLLKYNLLMHGYGKANCFFPVANSDNFLPTKFFMHVEYKVIVPWHVQENACSSRTRQNIRPVDGICNHKISANLTWKKAKGNLIRKVTVVQRKEKYMT